MILSIWGKKHRSSKGLRMREKSRTPRDRGWGAAPLRAQKKISVRWAFGRHASQSMSAFSL